MPVGNGDFVSKGECNAKFDQLINLFELSDKKIDKLSDNFVKLSDSFIEFKASREPILERLAAIEEIHKQDIKDKVQEAKDLKIEKESLPERRKSDRRWLIAILITLAFSIWGAAMGLVTMLKPAEQVQTVRVTRTPEPSPEPTEEQVYGP